MHNFVLYSEAWLLYIVLGITLLFLIDLKLKKSNFYFRVGFLSLIAVSAFTPQTVMDADSLAPLILSSVLNAEVDGVSAIYQGLLTLVIIWGIVMALILATKHFIEVKRNRSGNSNQPEKN